LIYLYIYVYNGGMLKNKGVNNMKKVIEKYERWLAVAEEHKANGVEYKDSNINEAIANYKQMLKVLKCPKFQQAIAGIFTNKESA